MTVKGSWQRPTQISNMEKDLRWELISSKTTEERKKQILQILEKMSKYDPNDNNRE